MPVFAAIDIGSNSVRLSIAELRGGRLVTLHQDRQVTRLGEAVFKDGNLDPQAMARTLKVLRGFHRTVQSYAVQRTRVVATSAMRDSNNGAVFADWLKAATGWNMDTISGFEEGRLIHLGVLASMRVPPARLLLIDLGGGSCELTLSEKGHVKEIISLPLGAVRLTQEFILHDPPSKDELSRLKHYIAEEAARIPFEIVRAGVSQVIATSGTAAALSGASQTLKLSGTVISENAIGKLLKKLGKMSQRQRAAIKGINSRRAEIIIAGAAVYAYLLNHCGLHSFRYSPLGLRDGVLAQMAAEYDSRTRPHQQLESDRQDVLQDISRRYRVDTANAEHVRNLALALYDQTRSVHNLDRAFRDWIATAALLYEVGAFINPAGRHRHAYYVISQSELFGFTPLQRKIIATIARYQGNSRPQLRDRMIKGLPAHLRSDVIKATAILRLGRALNQGRQGAVQDIKAKTRGDRLSVILKTGRSSVDLELWAGEKEVSYFREVFGRELLFKVV
ncbi:MAG TPA: Ppx/GppA phosphatase family protein [Candidatus Angelobacter sp.]|nr:Ppx/GppA phosphatase family protein [Candidatus Angelobacter sp.]